MLLQFRVKNFMSFKEETILNLTAGSEKEHQSSLLFWRDKKVLPTVVIYGANASGKSNLIAAITASLLTINESNGMQIGARLGRIVPFLFDDDSAEKPSEFSYIFTVNDVRYDYSFSADQNRIYHEALYAYYTNQPSLIFERTDTSNYRFILTKSKEYKSYQEKTAENKLFLATATAWNCQETREPFLWLSQSISTIYGNVPWSKALHAYENDTDGSLRKFSIKFLHQADINISDYELKSRLVNPEEYTGNPFAKTVDGTAEIKQYDIKAKHVVDDQGIRKEYTLPFAMESEGTQNLFYYAPYLKDALDQSRTIVIDEMDKSLHPLLARYIVALFHDPEINKNGAQLIFNTHDVSLLTLDNFRRDQIYFIDKNEKNGVSELYSLDEFSVRKSENVRASYLMGKYGAIPFIKGEE